MTYQDLTKILQNPDIAIAPGSLLPSIAAPSRPQRWTSEHAFQAAVIAECDQRAILWFEYGLIYAIPNGQYRPGQRPEAGIRSGMPDLCLPVARGGFHALYIELKVNGNQPSKEQHDRIAWLRMEGNHCVVIHDSLNDVMATIEEYLRNERN